MCACGNCTTYHQQVWLQKYLAHVVCCTPLMGEDNWNLLCWFRSCLDATSLYNCTLVHLSYFCVENDKMEIYTTMDYMF